MTSIRPWLPEGAITSCLPAATLRALVEAWSVQWFAAVRARPRCWTRSWTAEAGATAHQAGDGLLLATAPGGVEALAAGMFGQPPEHATPADRRRLDAAAGLCLNDLRQRLATLFGLAETTSWTPAEPESAHGWRTCAVDLPGHAGLLHVSVAEELLVERVRAALPRPAPGDPLCALSEALAPQPVRLSVLVGRCRLSLRDFEEWADGDVLLLDRLLDAPLDLAIEGAVRPDAPCRLVDAGDELHLLLT